MSSDLGSRAEMVKLGRLLGVEPSSLSFLEGIDGAALREFREMCTDVLFDTDAELLARLAAASKLLPAAMVAAISRRAFGPLLAARVTGFMEPRRAADIGKHLAPEFLADVTVQIDPRRSSQIIHLMETETILDVTEELLDREDFVTLGRFVGSLPPSAVEPVIDLTEDHELLRICAVAESTAGVEEVFALLSEERLLSVREMAGRSEMKREAAALRGHL